MRRKHEASVRFRHPRLFLIDAGIRDWYSAVPNMSGLPATRGIDEVVSCHTSNVNSPVRFRHPVLKDFAMKEEWKVILGFLAVVLTIFVLIYAVQTGRGYHLQWSGANGRWLWVDKDGRP